MGHLSGYGLWIVKNCVIFKFLADVSKKSKAVVTIYVYSFESSRFSGLENGICYYAMT